MGVIDLLAVVTEFSVVYAWTVNACRAAWSVGRAGGLVGRVALPQDTALQSSAAEHQFIISVCLALSSRRRSRVFSAKQGLLEGRKS